MNFCLSPPCGSRGREGRNRVLWLLKCRWRVCVTFVSRDVLRHQCLLCDGFPSQTHGDHRIPLCSVPDSISYLLLSTITGCQSVFTNTEIRIRVTETFNWKLVKHSHLWQWRPRSTRWVTRSTLYFVGLRSTYESGLRSYSQFRPWRDK